MTSTVTTPSLPKYKYTNTQTHKYITAGIRRDRKYYKLKHVIFHLVCHVSHVNEDEDNNDNVNNDRSTTETQMWRDGSFQLFKPRRLVTATTFTAITIIDI